MVVRRWVGVGAAGVGVWLILVCVSTCSLVASLPSGRPPLALLKQPAPGSVHGRSGELERQGMLRLRGGVPASDEESTEESKSEQPSATVADKKVTEQVAESATGGEAAKVSPGADEEEGHEAATAEGSGDGEDGEEGDSAAQAMMERPKPTPEIVQQMNERMWEAAQEGNEPLLAKALAGGANVNAFCRGPDRWLNISIGEIAGADDAHTGLNAHWM